MERGFVEDAGAGLAAVSEHRMITEDGDVRWVNAVATPVLVPDGPTERTVITMEDVTDRVLSAEALRTAEAAARAANDSKNQFLSRMSHELRTPLNAVLGFGQLLSRQLAGTEHAEAVDYVLKGGQHLLDLINDVLDISRIESGQMSLSMETVNLAALVDETLQLMRPLASAANVTLEPASGDPTVMLLADRQRVRQILLNLLSNAVKYNKDGGRVWVEWELDDDVVADDRARRGTGHRARAAGAPLPALRPAGRREHGRRGRWHRAGPDPVAGRADGRRRERRLDPGSRGDLPGDPARVARRRHGGPAARQHRRRPGRRRPPRPPGTARPPCSTSRTTHRTCTSSSTCSGCGRAGR